MSVKESVVSAPEIVGTNIVSKGANKAIQAFPSQKQNKIRGIFMVASALIMLVSGIKMLKNKNENMNRSELPGGTNF